MFKDILEKFLEWFEAQSIYVDFLSRMPEPLCDPIFSAALFTVFFCVSVSVVKGSISSWNFNRKMKKKARELEEMRANERLEDVRREKERKMERDAEINSRKEMKDMMEQYLKFMALVNAQNSVGQMMSLKNMSFEQWQMQMCKRQPDVIFVPPTSEEIEVLKPKNNIVYIDNNILENEILDGDAGLDAQKAEEAYMEKERQRIEAERREAERIAELERIARKQAEDKARVEEEARRKAEEEARLKAEEATKRKAFEEEQARIKAEYEQMERVKAEARAQAEKQAREEAEKREEEARLEAERLAEIARLNAEMEEERQRLEEERVQKEMEERGNLDKISELVGELESNEEKKIEENDVSSYVLEAVPEEVEPSDLEFTDEQESDFAKLVAMMASEEKQKGQISSYNQKKSEAKQKNIEVLDSQISSGIDDKKDTKTDKITSNDDALEQQKKEALARLEAEKNQSKKEKFSLFKKK